MRTHHFVKGAACHHFSELRGNNYSSAFCVPHCLKSPAFRAALSFNSYSNYSRGAGIKSFVRESNSSMIVSSVKSIGQEACLIHHLSGLQQPILGESRLNLDCVHCKPLITFPILSELEIGGARQLLFSRFGGPFSAWFAWVAGRRMRVV